MTDVPSELRSARLRLRRWTPHDLCDFADMNGDPVVMEYFPSTLTRQESDAFVDRIEDHFEAQHFGLWAVEIESTAAFAGYVGLWPATLDAHFTPAVEIGWRLCTDVWATGTPPRRHVSRLPMDSVGSVSTRSSRSPLLSTNGRVA